MDVDILLVGLGSNRLEILRCPFPLSDLPQILLDLVGNLGAFRTGDALYPNFHPTIGTDDKFHGFHSL
jgi:hypothetical protein